MFLLIIWNFLIFISSMNPWRFSYDRIIMKTSLYRCTCPNRTKKIMK